MSETIPCPWCAEDIKPAAKICRHCGSNLEDPTGATKPPPPQVDPATQKAANAGCTGCIGVFTFLFVLLLLMPSSNGGASSSSKKSTTSSATYKATYHVAGSASEASLTYQNESGGTDQKKVSLPWTYSFNGSPGDFLYLSAQNEKDYGTVTAEIKLNGKTVQSAETNDDYGIASVSGRI